MTANMSNAVRVDEPIAVQDEVNNVANDLSGAGLHPHVVADSESDEYTPPTSTARPSQVH